jgi:hypothetical protein
MSAAAGAGTTPLICVPEDADVAASGTHDKEAVASLYTSVIAKIRGSFEERRQMKQSYLACKKACGETVDEAALGEYLNVHQELQAELEAAHGEGYGTLVPTDVSNICQWWIHKGIETLQTKSKIWFIHYGTFQSHPVHSLGGLVTPREIAWAIDNYGTFWQIREHHPYSDWAQVSGTIGDAKHQHPLSKKQIDHVKMLPVHGYLYSCEIVMATETLLKSWAEENFQRKAAELRTAALSATLMPQSREILALRAELRAIKSTSPPIEDLLGITEASALPAVKSTAVFNAVEDASFLDT